MKNIKNVFGEGVLYEDSDLCYEPASIYCVSTACMSVWADFLSWANYGSNMDRLTHIDSIAEDIIVLSCQVTDLAIHNDLMHAKRLLSPDNRVFIGGCLAKRFDIPLEEYGFLRLDDVRKDGTFLYNLDCIDYAKPFWAKEGSAAGKIFYSRLSVESWCWLQK